MDAGIVETIVVSTALTLLLVAQRLVKRDVVWRRGRNNHEWNPEKPRSGQRPGSRRRNAR